MKLREARLIGMNRKLHAVFVGTYITDELWYQPVFVRIIDESKREEA